MKYFYLCLLFFISLNICFAGKSGTPPNISYTTPQVYSVNKSIPSLAPLNTGGIVPVANGYGRVVTLAGAANVPGSANGTGSAATFTYITSAVVDASGNIYVVDNSTSLIRKITPANVVSTFAGGTRGYADGTGTTASFNQPRGLAIDQADNIYVADQNNDVIRKITPSGVVITIAGTFGLTGNTDGIRSVATFTRPSALVLDALGNLYVSSSSNTIRKITPAGAVSTFAGEGAIGLTDGIGTIARFNNTGGMAVDAVGNIYVADINNNCIRKITPAGVVTTLAGSGTRGSADGAANTAQFALPSAVAVDATGNVYVNDEGNARIRLISSAGIVSTVAGNSPKNASDGIGTSAGFTKDLGMCADGRGYLYITDEFTVRKVTILGYTIDKTLPAGLTFDTITGIISGTPTATSAPTDYTITAYNEAGSNSTVVNISVNATAAAGTPPNINYATPQVYYTNTAISPLAPVNTGGAVPANIYGEVTTFAGGNAGFVNGTGTAASFSWPSRSVFDASGDLFVVDKNNRAVRKITPTGVVTTVASGGNLIDPNGIAIDVAGNLYVTVPDTDPATISVITTTIQKITPAGVMSTFASTGLSYSLGLDMDQTGTLFVADSYNAAIKKISPTGVITTLAGGNGTGFADGPGNVAKFYIPNCVKLDAAGNVFVSDPGNNRIRKVTPAGVVSTYAGSGLRGADDGPAATATFNSPGGIEVDDLTGNVYVVGFVDPVIRKIDPSGMVTTIAGSATTSGYADGVGTSALFNLPSDATLLNGYLFVSDANNNRIRKVCLTGYTIDKALPPGLSFDATTGIITGTPTAISPATIYTITGYNLYGSSTTTVSIQVAVPLIAQTITLAPMAAVTYGAANFNVAVTSTNSTIPVTFTSSNTAVATISAGGEIHVIGAGQTTITALQAGNNIFSAAAPVSQILVINPATINVKVNDQTKIYGAANPVGTFVYSGFVYADNASSITTLPVIVTTATVTSPVGTYPFGASGAVSPNYIFTYTAGTLTVSPAALNIIANNQTKVYGTANPALHLTYNTFVAGDDASKLTTQATVNTTANTLSDVGVYPIDVIGAVSGNYTITYTAGTLTITTVERVLTFPPIADQLIGAVDFDPGATVNTGDGIIYTSSNPAVAIIINGKIHIVGYGNVVITASVAAKANYADVLPKTQKFTVRDINGDVLVIKPLVTPNGDGINDVLRIEGVENYPDNKLTLVNANGIKIFEISGYDNKINVFEGRSNITGSFQPQGTYFYSLQYNDNGKVNRKVGFVVLKY